MSITPISMGRSFQFSIKVDQLLKDGEKRGWERSVEAITEQKMTPQEREESEEAVF